METEAVWEDSCKKQTRCWAQDDSYTRAKRFARLSIFRMADELPQILDVSPISNHRIY